MTKPSNDLERTTYVRQLSDFVCYRSNWSRIWTSKNAWKFTRTWELTLESLPGLESWPWEVYLDMSWPWKVYLKLRADPGKFTWAWELTLESLPGLESWPWKVYLDLRADPGKLEDVVVEGAVVLVVDTAGLLVLEDKMRCLLYCNIHVCNCFILTSISSYYLITWVPLALISTTMIF